MLSVNKYTREYIAGCRAKMEAQLAAYETLIAASGKGGAVGSASAIDAFEPLFFNNMVVVLDSYFVHRSRTLELKDGNPLNEVRMLCHSILQNDGVLAADKTIRFKAEKSVLKIQVGGEIKLTESDFVHLFRAFFAEIEAKFV